MANSDEHDDERSLHSTSNPRKASWQALTWERAVSREGLVRLRPTWLCQAEAFTLTHSLTITRSKSSGHHRATHATTSHATKKQGGAKGRRYHQGAQYPRNVSQNYRHTVLSADSDIYGKAGGPHVETTKQEDEILRSKVLFHTNTKYSATVVRAGNIQHNINITSSLEATTPPSLVATVSPFPYNGKVKISRILQSDRRASARPTTFGCIGSSSAPFSLSLLHKLPPKPQRNSISRPSLEINYTYPRSPPL